MKPILSGIILPILMISTAYASTESLDKQKAFKAVQQYANLTACEVEFKDVNQSTHEVTSEYGKVFYVVWTGNMNCDTMTGGLPTYVTHIGKYGDNGNLMVKTNYAFGESIDLPYRFIESIKKIGDKFEVIAKEHANPNEIYNFPSNRFKFTLVKENELPGFIEWKITNKTFIGKVKY